MFVVTFSRVNKHFQNDRLHNTVHYDKTCHVQNRKCRHDFENVGKKCKILCEQKPNINCSKFKQFPPLLLEGPNKFAGGRKLPFWIAGSTFRTHYPQPYHPSERVEVSYRLQGGWCPCEGWSSAPLSGHNRVNFCQLRANKKLQRDDGWSSARRLMSIFCKETPQQPQSLLSPDPCLIKVGQGSLITRTSCALLVVSLSYALSRCRSNYRLRWKSLLLPPARLRVSGERESGSEQTRSNTPSRSGSCGAHQSRLCRLWSPFVWDLFFHLFFFFFLPDFSAERCNALLYYLFFS